MRALMIGKKKRAIRKRAMTKLRHVLDYFAKETHQEVDDIRFKGRRKAYGIVLDAHTSVRWPKMKQ